MKGKVLETIRASSHWRRQNSMQMNRLGNKNKIIEFLDKLPFLLNQSLKVKFQNYNNKMLLEAQALIIKHQITTSNKISYQNSNHNFQTKCRCRVTSSIDNLKHIILMKITQWTFQLSHIVKAQRRIKKHRHKHLLKEVY